VSEDSDIAPPPAPGPFGASSNDRLGDVISKVPRVAMITEIATASIAASAVSDGGA
jgi:hypothetical protein